MKLPELRERREDIPLLIEHFVAKYNRLRHKDIVGLSESAISLLLRHDYPGNVRELENIIEHAFVLCPSGLIEPQHLPPSLDDSPAECGGTERANNARRTLHNLEAAFLMDLIRRHGGNRSAAAKDLGVHPSTLFRKIRSLGLRLSSHDGRHNRGG